MEWEFTKFRPPGSYDARNTLLKSRQGEEGKKPAREVKLCYVS
jgi:hypothetical protein